MRSKRSDMNSVLRACAVATLAVLLEGCGGCDVAAEPIGSKRIETPLKSAMRPHGGLPGLFYGGPAVWEGQPANTWGQNLDLARWFEQHVRIDAAGQPTGIRGLTCSAASEASSRWTHRCTGRYPIEQLNPSRWRPNACMRQGEVLMDVSFVDSGNAVTSVDARTLWRPASAN